ncbi:MAG: nucleotide exchange factor GrpE [Hyphomicrobiaceae bacterium]|nr:nucleotide exchange factor GrpE [Hyphomicrobiaceae bacterium]
MSEEDKKAADAGHASPQSEAAARGGRGPEVEPIEPVEPTIDLVAATAAAEAMAALAAEARAEQPVEPKPVDPAAAAAAIAELNTQIAELTDRLVRAHAEIQNLHRRRERDVADAAKYAISKFAGDTVGVADNFERAITSVPQGADLDNPVLKALLDGVTMTEREFFNVLDRHGVKRVNPKGEVFDPHKHQAVMEQEDRAVPAGTVLQVFQSGYIIGERVLRPAMVVVSRGGPKPVKEPNPQAGTNGDPVHGDGGGSGADDAAG